jgi:glycerol-3-phosphate dehydrogenase (NAD(P)+)
MRMRLNVAVIGAGSWGTTVASVASHNSPTVLWARHPDVADEINTQRTNSRYLGTSKVGRDLRATPSMAEAVGKADVIVMGVPSHGFRNVLEQVREHIRAWVPVISLAKGLEEGSLLRMTEVISDVLPGHPAGVLSGPNLAREIMSGFAAASVVAMEDETIVRELQQVFRSMMFRVYTNQDVIGCEVGGALKNVIAIAAGMGDGLGVGDNTKAAVIARGLAELTRLGVVMGGQAHTLAGLAGMGDLVATCMSPQSRNRSVGEQLGKGRTIKQIIDDMHMVAEGVKTSRVVMELSAKYKVEMPICREVYRVVHEGSTPTRPIAVCCASRGARSRIRGDRPLGGERFARRRACADALRPARHGGRQRDAEARQHVGAGEPAQVGHRAGIADEVVAFRQALGETLELAADDGARHLLAAVEARRAAQRVAQPLHVRRVHPGGNNGIEAGLVDAGLAQRRAHDVQVVERPELLVRAGFERQPHAHLGQLVGVVGIERIADERPVEIFRDELRVVDHALPVPQCRHLAERIDGEIGR